MDSAIAVSSIEYVLGYLSGRNIRPDDVCFEIDPVDPKNSILTVKYFPEVDKHMVLSVYGTNDFSIHEVIDDIYHSGLESMKAVQYVKQPNLGTIRYHMNELAKHFQAIDYQNWESWMDAIYNNGLQNQTVSLVDFAVGFLDARNITYQWDTTFFNRITISVGWQNLTNIIIASELDGVQFVYEEYHFSSRPSPVRYHDVSLYELDSNLRRWFDM